MNLNATHKPLFRSAVLASLALVASLFAAASSKAGPIVPAGLSIGDPYYLAFLTEGTQAANSSSIATYNSFVQSEAALNPTLTGTNVGVQYKAVASTSSTNALPNLGLAPGVPVYLLDGTTQIATTSGSGWLGATLSAAINITQYGVAPVGTPSGYAYVWTGTEDTGFPLTNAWLGGPFAPRIGTWFYSDNRWIEISTTNFNTPLRLYGVSSLLHVPPVPEPAAASLLGSALLAVLTLRRRRRGTQ